MRQKHGYISNNFSNYFADLPAGSVVCVKIEKKGYLVTITKSQLYDFELFGLILALVVSILNALFCGKCCDVEFTLFFMSS
jgi:hypothetical protein